MPRRSTFFVPFVLLICTVMTALPSAGEPVFPPAFVPDEDAVPDLTQTDPKGNFAGGGRSYCGPVAVSNSLMALFNEELRWNEVSHYKVVNQLASHGYMNTHAEKGTNVRQLMRGVERYLGERGEKNYHSHRKSPQQTSHRTLLHWTGARNACNLHTRRIHRRRF